MNSLESPLKPDKEQVATRHDVEERTGNFQDEPISSGTEYPPTLFAGTTQEPPPSRLANCLLTPAATAIVAANTQAREIAHPQDVLQHLQTLWWLPRGVPHLLGILHSLRLPCYWGTLFVHLVASTFVDPDEIEVGT
ncbi:uncharacterized protein SPPG_02545 [Spizellomyces punctatus DAOM BR117]|uniref:Uncharacterized protein n=1 Tax=Spizellomyces punctatus (strain DAOM BR117) TaxID=645134 RepID=A0A0L0HLQ2_SPIPD|nr:uncharacterized protein SPPG_02545 [Spizellomyces punctatus DAOM BR117]KND02042.1 hypothetical protein SPPG_02545 [Spizellomyces punctatus DAOM BR117]|eukprot:XP_016610081.1 hypothetical protein SPPG_02545 [Spizellomyces punctatus DAOM BR117]